MALANSWLADLLDGIKNVIWNGVTFAPRASIRFLGAGIASVFDNANNNSTDVTINGGGSAGVYGDGSDGTAVCDGTSTVVGMTLSGGNYTLTRDVFFTNLTINSGVSVLPSGFRVFALTLTVSGSLNADGSPGTATTGGAPGGGTGASPLAGGGIGGFSAGGQDTDPGLGGNGGAAGGGGGGGTVTPESQGTGLRALPDALRMASFRSVGAQGAGGTWDAIAGGAGGGSDNGANAGGGGGGGVLVVAAKALAGAGTISAKGGDGFAAASGGGGGGGGVVSLITGMSSFSGIISVAGGAGGAGAAPGVAGGAGTVIQLSG